ncbi:MAG: signal peptidase I [Moraxellaceae bacterium]
MDLDFALILTVAVLVAGVIWGGDALLFRPARRKRANDVEAEIRARLLSEEQEGTMIAPTELNAAIQDARAREMRESTLVEYAHSFFPVLFVVWALRSFLVEPFTIPSGSMLPTLQIGDYILVNKFSYGLRLPVIGTEIVPLAKPERGDIMVFKYPEQPRINFIKRVVGVPGDRVVVKAGRVWVNGKELSREEVALPDAESWEIYFREVDGAVSHMIRHEAGRESMSPEREWEVPAESYFMLGDNRDNSRDSRFWGYVPDRYIVGKAFFIWMHKKPGWNLPEFGRNGKVI